MRFLVVAHYNKVCQGKHREVGIFLRFLLVGLGSRTRGVEHAPEYDRLV
jgi:hypothetical protein